MRKGPGSVYVYPWSFVTKIFHNGQSSHGVDRKTFEVMGMKLFILKLIMANSQSDNLHLHLHLHSTTIHQNSDDYTSALRKQTLKNKIYIYIFIIIINKNYLQILHENK